MLVEEITLRTRPVPLRTECGKKTNNHIPSLTGRTGRGVTIVSTNILSLTGQMTTRFLTTSKWKF